MKIILASTSPRRKQLLKQFGVEFDIIQPEFDEKFENKDFTFEKIENVSLNKAKSIEDKITDNSVIISADTVVVFENKILLKPKDRQDAFNMLKNLSGKEHFVVTGYTLLQPKTKKQVTNHVKSIVSFASLSDEQINDYIDNYKPLDKAGAYGLQELPDYFGAKTKGSINNVIGLPVEEILEDLKNFNLPFFKDKKCR